MAVMGIQNYYCIATNIYNNLTDVNYALHQPLGPDYHVLEVQFRLRKRPMNFNRKL